MNEMKLRPPKPTMKPRVRDMDEEIVLSPDFEEEYEFEDPEVDMALYTALVCRLVDSMTNKRDLTADDEEALEDRVLGIISSIAAQQDNGGKLKIVQKRVAPQVVSAPANGGNTFSLSRLKKVKSRGPKNKPMMKTGLTTGLIFQSALSNSYDSAFKRSLEPKLDKNKRMEMAYKIRKEKIRDHFRRVDREEEMEMSKGSTREVSWFNRFPALTLKPGFF